MIKKSPGRLGIIYNLKRKKIHDHEEEYDELFTIKSLKKQLQAFGFKVVLLEQDKNFFSKISRLSCDFVFNLAEGIGSSRNRESQVPCVLESLNIPYSGSDPLSLGITMDKYLCHQLLRLAGLPMPDTYSIQKESEIFSYKKKFSKGEFIVKPRWEGSSKGIFLDSLASDFKDLKKNVLRVLSKYRQPALIEEFLPGDEITVGVCGNKSPKLLGMMRICPKKESRDKFIYSLEVKRDWKALVKYEPESMISFKTKNSVSNYALAAFKALGLRDISRIDFRLDSKGEPKIIDINPLPGLSPRYSDLPIICRLQGKTYAYLVEEILKAAFSRYGFAWRKI
jgi:D-alanine-D-alanine ligase